MKVYYIDGNGEINTKDLDYGTPELVVDAGDVDFEPITLTIYKWAIHGKIVGIAGLRMAEAQYLALQIRKEK